MALIKYIYHALAAAALNLLAKHWSARLREIGKRSNAHEKARGDQDQIMV